MTFQKTGLHNLVKCSSRVTVLSFSVIKKAPLFFNSGAGCRRFGRYLLPVPINDWRRPRIFLLDDFYGLLCLSPGRIMPDLYPVPYAFLPKINGFKVGVKSVGAQVFDLFFSGLLLFKR